MCGVPMSHIAIDQVKNVVNLCAILYPSAAPLSISTSLESKHWRLPRPYINSVKFYLLAPWQRYETLNYFWCREKKNKYILFRIHAPRQRLELPVFSSAQNSLEEDGDDDDDEDNNNNNVIALGTNISRHYLI